MDWGLFWVLLIMPMVIYISILSMFQKYFLALGQKIFYVAVVVINIFAIFAVISMAKEEGKFDGGLVAGILGLAASGVLGYMMFNWAVAGDKRAAEEWCAKEDRRERLEKEKEKDILIQKFYEEVFLLIENKIKIIASAYRKSVTSNSFGKKNYTKFIPEFIDFIEDDPSIIKIKKELEEKHDFMITLSLTDGIIISYVEEVIDELDQDLEYTNDMDPFEYEHYCASQFKKNGWDAEATQGSSDQGVDVIASKNGFTIVAQCKKYAKPVGNKAVQEIVAGKNHYKADKGIVIASSGFTNSAAQLAASNNIDLIHHTEIKDL